MDVPSKIHIVTFADRSMAHTHRRFRRQAREMNLFASISCLTEMDLDEKFSNVFSSQLNRDVRGFGFYVWKPQVIIQALKAIPTGDYLLYLDSGSHLNSGGRSRFLDYVSEVDQSQSGILAFELPFLERHWTKGDLLDYFGVRTNEAVVDSRQIQAGCIFVHNRPGILDFFEKWLTVFESDFALVDDTPSKSPNLEGFREHRHDQSVFSICGKIAGISLLQASEQFPEGSGNDWDLLAQLPIHHRRDKTTWITKLKSKVRRKLLPLEVFLVKAKRFATRPLRS